MLTPLIKKMAGAWILFYMFVVLPIGMALFLMGLLLLVTGAP